MCTHYREVMPHEGHTMPQIVEDGTWPIAVHTLLSQLCLAQGIPDAATLVDLAADGKPDMATQREEHVRHVAVGATMLVKPGETVRRLLVPTMTCH